MPADPKPARRPAAAAIVLWATLLWATVLGATLLGTTPAKADDAPPAPDEPTLDNAALYQDCMARARLEPEEALMIADAWALAGGGDAAEHCTATALFARGDYGEAARRLDALAERVRDVQPQLAADLLAQASTAYRLSEQEEGALSALDRAIAIRPDDGPMLLERARLLGRQGDFAAALADLDRAQPLLADDPDVYLLRAAARRRLGALDLARGDVEMGLSLDPGNPELLLERGNIRRLHRDPEGARADWTAVIAAAPGSEAARAAEANLQRLGQP